MTKSAPVVILLAVWSQLVPARPHVEVNSAAVIRTVDATVEQEHAVEDALALFVANGLGMPELEVHFMADESACNGHYGLFQERFTPWRVLICSPLPFVIPHEFAHAWERANLSDDDRLRYTEMRGLESWDDRSTAWVDRAREDAAMMIQKNLTAEYAELALPIWHERIAAYEFLTGRVSPVLALAPST